MSSPTPISIQKQMAKGLIAQRDIMEQEIAIIASRLTAAGAAGINGSLLDAEGFPRSDVDVSGVRADRQQLIMRTNDHAALTQRIDQALVEIHAHGSSAHSSGALRLTPMNSGSVEKEAPPKPYAVIDELAEGSPAEAAGLLLGDLMCSFGGVKFIPDEPTTAALCLVTEVLAANEGLPVETIIQRNWDIMTLTLTPQKW
eukprot:CAMPEP_0119108998 /NCGR_PEP_ID=MMETSP1180-20130426/16706_1 /TAXON_ID=3052 ORGANISM="Chlamydomonas cf sp, Strain CCMP681" /NCGR_SAMPLE_ID=MMETSP1180 /ASSEMBLY_ACC=CAM_ASM_000741 /LENGTH=199 /DNA_ID=CAMNT_0007094689 /DNA_START=102 /DNA_END=698 /DNA_ORIENTATION=-